MLTTIKGIYKNGQVILEEQPDVSEETAVIITFLERDTHKSRKSIRIGSMAGAFVVPDDFNEPLNDLKEYM